MKNFFYKQLVLLLSCLASISISAQTYYYYYKGQKVFLELDVSKVTLITDNDFQESSIASMGFKNFVLTNDYQIQTYKFANIEFVKKLNINEYLQKLEVLNSNPRIIKANPNFKNSSGKNLGLSNYFYVKLKKEADIQALKTTVQKNNVIIIEQNRFMPLWYTLMVTKNTIGNSMEVSNLFYETGLFDASQPDFLSDDVLCTNDPMFSKLWGLRNTKNPNYDINICEAWSISEGINTKIAVLDQGIFKDHIDLHSNIYSLSYNTETNSSPSKLLGRHGTHCAGTIAAVKNNNIQVVGVSPLAKLIDISNSLSSIPNSRIKRADGLNWAWKNGADIISNSWGSSVKYQIIDDAIDSALTRGRNGKGCVVVFASGNDHDFKVGYPANSNSNILAVGAMNYEGYRANFSNYGKELDVVAPGVDILSTIPNNEIDSWNGTSMATPHVAGVAALILSVNPNLTGQEVRDIIEKTAQKVRPDLYNYQSDQSHPNGTWNNEMGYGLVDAYAAVKMAKIPDTPADLLIRDYVGDDGEEPSYDPNDWVYKLLQHNPDIKLLDIDTQQPIHSIGMYKKKNCYIAVNIKNIGGKTTEGNGKERLHLFSQSYLITTLPKYVLPYYERLTPTKGLPIGKLAYNEQKVAAGLFNWELPEKKLIATAERLKKAFPSVNNPIWGFDILAIADENGNSIIKSTADTVFIAHGAEDIARRYNSAAMGYWQRRTLWDDIFNQIIRILPTANVPFSLSLSQPVDIKRGRIKDFAEVNILLSNSLMAKLITAGNPNIKVIDQNRVRLLSADAKLEFRPMSNNREDYFAGVEVKFFSDLLPQINSFDFGLSYSEQGKEPEMVHFTAIRNSSVYFKAQAEASKTQVAGNETVTLTATNIGDEATYTWYNRSGNVIGTGTSITTVPTATDTYTLEVEREDNGYKSYGEVEVVALAGKIVSLSPNPAHSTFTVKYKLPDNAVIASIQITNIQNNISKTYAISTTATEKTISLEGLSVGSYIVKLIADGKTLHSQNLLIK